MALSLLRQQLQKLLMATIACCMALGPLVVTGFNSETASWSTGPQSSKNNYAFGSTNGKEIPDTTENKNTSIWDVIYTIHGSTAYKNIKQEDNSAIDHISFTTFSHKDANVGTQSNIAHISERDTTTRDGKVTISNGTVTSGFVSSSVTTTFGVPPNSKTTSSPAAEEATTSYTPTATYTPTASYTPTAGYIRTATYTPKSSSFADTYWQKKAHDNIFIYVSPILIVSGTVGNALSAIILQNRLFWSSSTGFILTALALLDIAVLNTGLMQVWLAYAFSIKIRNMSSFSCKFHNLLTYYLRQLASWTLILLTVERTVAVCFPLRCRELCSKRRILLSWFGIAFLLFAANSFFLVCFDLQPEVENGLSGNNTTSPVVTYVCYVRSEWIYFFEDQWCWIDAFLGDFFPSAVVLIGNIVTVTKIMHSHPAQLRQQPDCTSRRKEKMASTTAMLIAVSLLFLVLTLPLDAFIIYYAYRGTSAFGELDQAIYDLGYAVVTILYYANNAFDFLMYLVSGRKFRQALLETFLPCRKITNRSSQTANRMHGNAAIAINYIGSQPGTQSAKKSTQSSGSVNT